MTREDLFAAIGKVEDSRLAKTELAVTGKKASAGRVLKNILVAVMVSLTLLLAGCAAVGYILYDNPLEMLTDLFGDQTGYDHHTGGKVYNTEGQLKAIEPTYDRVPADEKLISEEIVPMVSPVGQSISWQGYTVTVDAVMYDTASRCGVLTYTLENPNGFRSYSVSYDGEVVFEEGGPIEFSCYGYDHIIEEKSTETKLALAYYFNIGENEEERLEVTIGMWSWRTAEMAKEDFRKMQEMTREEFEAWHEAWSATEPICPDVISIPLDQQNALKHIILADGRVEISPISIQVDTTGMDFLEVNERLNADNIKTLTIRYLDGTEYPVWGDNLENTVFSMLSSDMMHLKGMFNRIIDVEKVAAVIINGVEFTVQ